MTARGTADGRAACPRGVFPPGPGGFHDVR